jgi:hypothetical protein
MKSALPLMDYFTLPASDPSPLTICKWAHCKGMLPVTVASATKYNKQLRPNIDGRRKKMFLIHVHCSKNYDYATPGPDHKQLATAYIQDDVDTRKDLLLTIQKTPR